MKTNHIAWIGGTLVIVVTTISYLSLTNKKTETTKKQISHTTIKTPKPNIIPTKTKNSNLTHINKKPSVKKVVQPTKQNTPSVAKRLDGNTLFTTDYLPLQQFKINTKRDTQVVAKGGMKISIPANAFEYKNGRQIEGVVTFQVKEAFSPEDIVMANLVTKKGKQLLESGGMYYMNATAEGSDLKVADDKDLTVEVPTNKTVKGMELYEGVAKEGGLDWTNPVKLNKEEVLMEKSLEDASKTFGIAISETKVTDTKGGKQIVKRVDTLGWVNRNLEGFNFNGGKMNTCKQDNTLKYVMNTKRLGWANIDCLYHDPRSREITFITEVNGNKEFDDVYISMMFKTKRVYLAGYEKANGTYSFTHGDYENPVMPVGEKATIMVSAHKDGKQYFDVQDITISDNTFVNMQPSVATMEEVKLKVKNSL